MIKLLAGIGAGVGIHAILMQQLPPRLLEVLPSGGRTALQIQSPELLVMLSLLVYAVTQITDVLERRG